MSLQKKYYYNFKGLDGTQYTTEIWHNTASVITPEEITGYSKPFSIEYPTTDLFEPVKGSGCELNLLSTTDRKFFGLYTANMMEYQIRFYKSGVLVWCGFLDSELYSEPFNESENYCVTFTGSDGFALLERLNYLDSGSKYSGLMTQWQVVQNIINKLALPYRNIYVGLSTTSTDFTIGSTETILHKTYTNNQNWYNEDGEPETARKVLESILQPYGAYIVQDNASLYITDVNTVAGATTTSFKKYDSSFNYVSTASVNLNLGDLSNIRFSDTSQQMNVVSGFNKQVLKYSPYITPELIDFNAANDFSVELNSTTYGVDPYQWTETTHYTSNTFNRSGNLNALFASYVGVGKDNENNNDSYLKLTKYTPAGAIPENISYTNKTELPIFIPSDCKLKISAKAYVRTVDNLNGTTANPDIKTIKVRCRLKIGDKQYYNNVWGMTGRQTGWISSTSTDYDKCIDLDFQQQAIVVRSGYKYAELQPVENTWVDLKLLSQNGGGGLLNPDLELKMYSDDFLIPLSTGFAGGQMSLEIYDFDANSLVNTVRDIRLKDISLTIVDSKGNEIKNADVEYIGYMNQSYKNEGSNITLLQGSSVLKTPKEKGSLIANNGNYYYLNQWTREGKTDCIENLLLRSIVSNYTNKRIQLTASINQINSGLGCLKYDAFLAGKNLLVVGMSQNFADSSTTVTLQEVVKDNLEINKSW